MIFSLEALQAFNGDALLLHGGTAQEPVLVLIDGGPTRTWGKSLKPRLEQLREERAPGGALRIELAMLSHIDDDHIGGLVAFGNELVTQQADSKPLSYDVGVLWFNSFDDVVGNSADELRAAALEALDTPIGDPRADELREAGRAVVASVPNGRTLRDQATQLGWGHNDPFDGLVVLPATGARSIEVGGMKLTVVCPHEEELGDLARAWENWLKKASKKDEAAAAPAEFSDSSPYNLSSIVVHVEREGKTMLLTGDARGDHVLSGLDQAQIAKDGKTHVDILKLPHHGSLRNIDPTFFERVTADHYVVSANGHDGNPDKETLDMIVAARAGDDDFEIHLTNDETDNDSMAELVQHVSAFRADKQASGRQFRMSARNDPELSLRIDLLEGG